MRRPGQSDEAQRRQQAAQFGEQQHRRGERFQVGSGHRAALSGYRTGVAGPQAAQHWKP